MKKKRVLIVDDSVLVRGVLSKGLSGDSQIEVVGAASDPYKARDMILQLKPDVLTLDVEMPRMTGLEFLKKLMPQYPLPVIMVSSLTDRGSKISLDALAAGAVDFVLKPATSNHSGLSEMIMELREKVKMAAAVNVSSWKNKVQKNDPASRVQIAESVKSENLIIAIGASTGGTEALKKVLSAMPKNSPGIVVVQHMPAGFTKMFAERLNRNSDIDIKEAKSGDTVSSGQALIAPGDKHLKLIKADDTYRVICRSGEKVNGHRPSVEVLFNSVARYAGSKSIGVMLTGMGSDGADAMLKMRQAGARTMAQDKNSSVVFGMPKEAYERGGAESLVALNDIPRKIKLLVEEINS